MNPLAHGWSIIAEIALYIYIYTPIDAHYIYFVHLMFENTANPTVKEADAGLPDSYKQHHLLKIQQSMSVDDIYAFSSETCACLRKLLCCNFLQKLYFTTFATSYVAISGRLWSVMHFALNEKSKCIKCLLFALQIINHYLHVTPK